MKLFSRDKLKIKKRAQKKDGFDGWNGEDWGMPDISSVQKFDDESREGTY